MGLDGAGKPAATVPTNQSTSPRSDDVVHRDLDPRRYDVDVPSKSPGRQRDNERGDRGRGPRSLTSGDFFSLLSH